MVKVKSEEIEALKELCDRIENKVVEAMEGIEKDEKQGEEHGAPATKKRKVSPLTTEDSFSLGNLQAIPQTTSGAAAPQVKTAGRPSLLQLPGKDMTGVSENTTRVCAKLSKQIYVASTAEDFDLTTNNLEAECFIFDDHESLDVAIPAFAAATTSDQTMILGWRGTTTPLDWISDFSLGPTSSSRWGKEVAKSIRGQGMYCAFIESDLTKHEDSIVRRIRKKKINRIVCTGHSLGGGMAQLAHLFIQAQIDGDWHPWTGLNTLKCRSLAFAAPMTMIDVDELDEDKSNTQAQELMKKLAENSCNIVFGSDVVPRSYAYLDYVLDAFHAVLRSNWALHLLAQWAAHSFLKKFIKTVKAVGPVAVKFRHIGYIVHYTKEDALPIKLIDEGPSISVVVENPTLFSYYTYASYGTPDGEHIKTLEHDHLFFPEHIAEYRSVPQTQPPNRTVCTNDPSVLQTVQE